MERNIFGKFVNNNSILTKIDARLKLFIAFALLILNFLNFSIFAYFGLFLFLLILHSVGKLNLKSLGKMIVHMWLLIVVLLIVNLLTMKGQVLFSIGSVNFCKEGFIQTGIIVLRIIIILMISSLLTATTQPQQLTYAIEFYLYPLKIFKLNIYEISLMMSIALRCIPLLYEEMLRIMDAQTSRGVDFKHDKYMEKVKALTSVIGPLFSSCFQKSEELSEAMTVKGYGMGERSRYHKFKLTWKDYIFLFIVIIVIVGICFLNGVKI